MKSVNSFEVTGFIVNDANVNKFDNASVARFGLAIARTEGKDDKKKRTSAILNIEIWRSNKNAADLDLLKKGQRITVKGFLQAGRVHQGRQEREPHRLRRYRNHHW